MSRLKWNLQSNQAINAGIWNSVIYANETFVAVGRNVNNDGVVMTSTDGGVVAPWLLRDEGVVTQGDWASVTYGNKFLAVGLEE